MAAGRYLTGAWRTVSSAFTLDPAGEKFAFARFRGGGGGEEASATGGYGHGAVAGSLDQGATELAEMQSNGAAARRRNEDGESRNDAGDFCPTDDDSESKKDRNQISAWQAGWNVTNAIQVNNTLELHETLLTLICIAPRSKDLRFFSE